MASTPTRPVPDALLQCVNVSKHYPDGNVTALDGINLVIQPREYVAIMGPSGSGKSTLLHLLGALDAPNVGEVFFQGLSLQASCRAERIRATRIGFVFQVFHLLPTLTAVENVQIPMFEGPLAPRARRSKAEKLLSEVGLSQRLRHFPSQLSGGERQRVAIARALANDPVLILADEPTGNLDSANSEAILALFDQVRRERQMTLLVVTHSAEVSLRTERIISLRDGRIQDDRRQIPVSS
jgi:putative ABC transport system ATP-binding protein